MKRPIIGIPTIHGKDERNRGEYKVPQSYVDAIIAAGGIPLLIPLNILASDDVELLKTTVERLDGILLAGGGDVHPEYYQQYISDMEFNVDRNRDAMEITLAKWAYEEDFPLLGICRGSQVINVALGGTLIHDIPSQTSTNLIHDRDDGLEYTLLAHSVAIEPSSKLANILGETTLTVNSAHHQSVDVVAPPLQIVAHAEDGMIEAIEAPHAFFYVGVQWHPEWITKSVPSMQKLFGAFVEACIQHAGRKIQA